MKKKILPPSDLDNFMNKAGRYGYDTLGSYTGIPADPDDLPVQDADDL